MITRAEGGSSYTQTFNAENRLVSVTVGTQTTQFVYDGDGNQVKQINPNGTKTIRIEGVYEEDRSSGGSLTGTRVYYAAGGAMRVNGTLYYVMGDNLGSAVLTLSSTGATVGQERYFAFGTVRFASGTMQTDRLFTGQRSAATLGLMDYRSRFYDPLLSRFISPDSIIPGYANPQALNRYSYVYNDPVDNTDPTGNEPNWKLRKLKADYGRYWNDVKAIYHDGGALPDLRPAQQTAATTLPQTLAVPDDFAPNGGVGLNPITSRFLNGDSWWLDRYGTLPKTLRGPDYITLNIATGVPFGWAGVDFQITRDYYNDWYFSPGVEAGSPGATLFGGWLLQDDRPGPTLLRDFVSSHSVFGGGGFVVGFGGTWGRPLKPYTGIDNDFAAEAGLSSPGGAVGYVYGIPIILNPAPTVP